MSSMNIFAAVGTQFPFDRLIRCIDAWVGTQNAKSRSMIFHAQIAEGEYTPEHGQWERFMTTDTFNQHLNNADLIISHAGMGNIITALENRKPIIVMNRQAALGEHRNDHQADGLEWMGALDGVYTATSCDELTALLAQPENLKAAANLGLERRQQLAAFIDQAIPE